MAPAIVILSLTIRINIMSIYRLQALSTPPQSSFLFFVFTETNAKLVCVFHLMLSL